MRAASSTGWLGLTSALGLTVATVDITLGSGTSLTGLLLVCPLLATVQLDGRSTAAVSAGTVLLALAVSTWEHTLTHGDVLIRLLTLIAASLYATWAAHQHARLDQQLGDVAAVAQRAILQPASFRTGPIAVCARYRSAAPQAVIGGDLYAFTRTPTGLRLLIGDVRGKGLAAVRLSAAAIGHFRDAAYTQPHLPAIVRELDRRLTDDLETEDFITALAAEITPGSVRLANCGHHPPLHLPATGRPALLAPPQPTTPLGLHPDPQVHEVALAPGDRLLFYTDGLTEARNPDGDMPDLTRIATLCTGPSLDESLEAVLAAPGPPPSPHRRRRRRPHPDRTRTTRTAPGNTPWQHNPAAHRPGSHRFRTLNQRLGRRRRDRHRARRQRKQAPATAGGHSPTK